MKLHNPQNYIVDNSKIYYYNLLQITANYQLINCQGLVVYIQRDQNE